MSIPFGYVISDSNKVCEFNKPLYGLKQASIQWHVKLFYTILFLCLTQSQAEHSIYPKHTTNDFFALLVYVNDSVLIGDSIMEINVVNAFLHNKFRIKDLGQLRYFIGLEIAKYKSSMFSVKGNMFLSYLRKRFSWG